MAQGSPTPRDDRPRPTRRNDSQARPTRRQGAQPLGARAEGVRTRRGPGESRSHRNARTSSPETTLDLRFIAPIVIPAALALVLLLAISSCVRSCSGGSERDEAAQAGQQAQVATTTDAEADDTAADGGVATSDAASDGSDAAKATTDDQAQAEPPRANSDEAVWNPTVFKRRLLTSTPRDQWASGTVPLILQKDPQWATLPYAGGVIGTHGCGPTALAMAYVHLTGDTSYDPVKMCAFSEEMGYVEAGVTGWRLMDEGAAELGLTVHPVITTVTGLRQALEAGQVLVQDCDPGDFTEHGHFIVIVGIDENDQLEIRDPNSWRNTQQLWDAQRVLDQHRNIWGFSYDG